MSTEENLTYQVQDLINWRYIVVEHEYCADTEKALKNKKRKK